MILSFLKHITKVTFIQQQFWIFFTNYKTVFIVWALVNLGGVSSHSHMNKNKQMLKAVPLKQEQTKGINHSHSIRTLFSQSYFY